MKRLTSFAVVALAVALLAASMTAPTQAAEDQSAVDIHGFGGWAAGYTSNDNQYPAVPFPLASHDVEVENSYFTLNIMARPLDKCVILAQPTWQTSLRGKEMRLDLAYVELTLAKDLRLRAGKIKNPLGLYTDIYKVGTLRPFYLLPNSYYRLAPESYAGLGLNRVQRLGSWELELDLLAGQMDFEPSDADAIIGFDTATMQYQYGSIPVTARGRDVVGGGALLRLPVKGLEVGVSAYSMKLWGSIAGGPMEKLSEDRQKAYAGAIEYVTDKVALRAEGILARGYEDDDCAYVEAAYHITDRWQVAATYDYGNFKKPPAVIPAAASLKKNQAIGVGLNYWISPKLVWKLDYYHVKDNSAARPPDAILAAIAGTLPNKTDVVVGGIHFSF
jgi:hypothetical protein